MARDDAPRVELAARAEGARRGACLEHGAEGGGRGWEPGGGHATECGGCGGRARVSDEAGEKRVPCDGVPRGHFVEQAGRSAWEPRVRVGGEEGSGRDRDGTREGGGLEQDGVNSGGEREGWEERSRSRVDIGGGRGALVISSRERVRWRAAQTEQLRG